MAWYQSDINRGAQQPPYVPCSWSTGSDIEIVEALEKHYADEVDLTEYWAIGDERVIHLNGMPAPMPDTYGSWLEQDIVIVIVAFNHTDLATPINGHDKAAITVQTRELLSGTSAGTRGSIYINGNSSKDTSFTKWSNLYMRTYLNSTVWGAFPTGDFKAGIKPSKHYRHTTYNGTASEEVTDNLFLPSYPEIFGTESFERYVPTSPVEGTQWEYYANGDSTRRIKYINNNGLQGNTAYWWQSSPHTLYSSSNGYSWCTVTTNGSASGNDGANASGLAPAWAM